MDYKNPISCEFNGSIAGVDLNGREIVLDNEELRFIANLPGVTQDGDDNFAGVTEIKDQIAVLFAMNLYDDAWRVIEENKRFISFKELVQIPFFVINTEATELYRYYRSIGELDDKNYLYFNIIHGSFFDEDFMISDLGKFLHGKDLFDHLYEAYSYGNEDAEPLKPGVDAPYIEYTDTLKKIIKSVSIEGSDLGIYIVGYKKTINFSPDDIIYFVDNKNIKSVDIARAITTYDETFESVANDHIEYTENSGVFKMLDTMYGENAYNEHRDIPINNERLLNVLIEYSYVNPNYDCLKDIINSDFVIMYPSITASLLATDYFSFPINISERLLPSRFSLINLFEEDPKIFNTIDFKYSALSRKIFVVWNTVTNIVRIGSRTSYTLFDLNDIKEKNAYNEIESYVTGCLSNITDEYEAYECKVKIERVLEEIKKYVEE